MKKEITEIQIVSVKPNNGLVAFASFVYDKSFYFSSIGIYTKQEGGYRLTYPTRKTDNSNFNIFHPINKEVASHIEQKVIIKFEEVMKKYGRHNSFSIK